MLGPQCGVPGPSEPRRPPLLTLGCESSGALFFCSTHHIHTPSPSKQGPWASPSGLILFPFTTPAAPALQPTQPRGSPLPSAGNTPSSASSCLYPPQLQGPESLLGGTQPDALPCPGTSCPAHRASPVHLILGLASSLQPPSILFSARGGTDTSRHQTTG